MRSLRESILDDEEDTIGKIEVSIRDKYPIANNMYVHFLWNSKMSTSHEGRLEDYLDIDKINKEFSRIERIYKNKVSSFNGNPLSKLACIISELPAVTIEGDFKQSSRIITDYVSPYILRDVTISTDVDTLGKYICVNLTLVSKKIITLGNKHESLEFEFSVIDNKKLGYLGI